MTIPATGPISLGGTVNVEIGQASNTPINLGGGAARALAAIASGAIRFSNLRGKTFVPPPESKSRLYAVSLTLPLTAIPLSLVTGGGGTASATKTTAYSGIEIHPNNQTIVISNPSSSYYFKANISADGNITWGGSNSNYSFGGQSLQFNSTGSEIIGADSSFGVKVAPFSTSSGIGTVYSTPVTTNAVSAKFSSSNNAIVIGKNALSATSLTTSGYGPNSFTKAISYTTGIIESYAWTPGAGAGAKRAAPTANGETMAMYNGQYITEFAFSPNNQHVLWGCIIKPWYPAGKNTWNVTGAINPVSPVHPPALTWSDSAGFGSQISNVAINNIIFPGFYQYTGQTGVPTPPYVYVPGLNQAPQISVTNVEFNRQGTAVAMMCPNIPVCDIVIDTAGTRVSSALQYPTWSKNRVTVYGWSGGWGTRYASPATDFSSPLHVQPTGVALALSNQKLSFNQAGTVIAISHERGIDFYNFSTSAGWGTKLSSGPVSIPAASPGATTAPKIKFNYIA